MIKDKKMDNPSAWMRQTLFRTCPAELYGALLAAAGDCAIPLYLSGGTVRDMLLGREANDLDLTVPSGSMQFCKRLIRLLGGGVLVDLSVPEEETVRLIWNGLQVDVSSFRSGVATIEEDLRLRDFTINAIAVDLSEEIWHLIDPAGGGKDLDARLVRHLPRAFVADPLRILRAYRLAAVLGFAIGADTKNAILRNASLIGKVSAERIDYELQKMFSVAGTAAVILDMAGAGLLHVILPELMAGCGITQPEFHHLDVFGHSIRTLEIMDDIVVRPDRYFAARCTGVFSYTGSETARRRLKWAALLHDIGKPGTRSVRAPDGRVTFYRHDESGATLFQNIADRLKWSRVGQKSVGQLIGMHMRPFHLYNAYRKEGLTRRAALNLYRQAGAEIPGLFVLAMADSLASEGEKKPDGLEADLVRLYMQLQEIIEDCIRPVVKGERHLNGHDLIDLFHLEHGPRIGKILSLLETAQVEGIVTGRSSAMDWVAQYLRRKSEQ